MLSSGDLGKPVEIFDPLFRRQIQRHFGRPKKCLGVECGALGGDRASCFTEGEGAGQGLPGNSQVQCAFSGGARELPNNGVVLAICHDIEPAHGNGDGSFDRGAHATQFQVNG